MRDADPIEPVGEDGFSGAYAPGESESVERIPETIFGAIEDILGKAEFRLGRRETRIDLDRRLECRQRTRVLAPHPQYEPSDVIAASKSRVYLDRAAGGFIGEANLQVRIGAPAAEDVRNMRVRQASECLGIAVVDAERTLKEAPRRGEILCAFVDGKDGRSLGSPNRGC